MPPHIWYQDPLAIYVGELPYLAVACVGSGVLVRKYFELAILRLK